MGMFGVWPHNFQYIKCIGGERHCMHEKPDEKLTTERDRESKLFSLFDCDTLLNQLVEKPSEETFNNH